MKIQNLSIQAATHLTGGNRGNGDRKENLCSLRFLLFNSHTKILAAGLLLASAGTAPAEVHYVDLNSTNATPPYTNWTTAATNIQDAVDAAVAGDEIVVTNGIYYPVVVGKPLDLRSVNGSQFTAIDGGGAVRCVDLTSGASLSGFTLTNGFPGRSGDGGGAYGGTLNDCTLSHNQARGSGGGAYGCALNHCALMGNSAWSGGGAYGGTLNDCTLSDNSAVNSGGGVSGSTLINCTLSSNVVSGCGGGASYCTLNNCTLTGNSATNAGGSGGCGGGAYQCTLNNCSLIGNLARVDQWSLGGHPEGGGAYCCTLNNSTLSSNLAILYQRYPNSENAYGGGASSCTLNNCTLTGNQASVPANLGILSAHAYGGGASYGTLNNCIVYSNMADIFPSDYYSTTLNYCWTGSDPLFADFAGGNLRLQSNSPCINAGNNSYVTNATDLDGNPRIAGGTVDIGAYEFQAPASRISYAWLQQYGLPINADTDAADPDGDGLNNWQEWRCLTDPTNALSVLRLLAPATVGTNVIVTWQSVVGVYYFLERSASLAAPAAFSSIATNLPGQPGRTRYTDTNAVGSGPFFYRVGVQ